MFAQEKKGYARLGRVGSPAFERERSWSWLHIKNIPQMRQIKPSVKILLKVHFPIWILKIYLRLKNNSSNILNP